jgi:hypothetical protein
VSEENIINSLRVAAVAAEALAKLSSLMIDYPELEDAFDRCSYVMNETLDGVADDLISLLPEIPRPPPPKWRTNGHSHGRLGGIQLLSGPGAASRDGVDPDPPEEEESPWEPTTEREVSRCKALLLEVLRRAAHDWVLYRQHRKLDKRELAHDAYIWLFEEDDRHPYRRERQKASFPGVNGRAAPSGARALTSFHSVCEHLDLDPGVVRERIKKMDARSIIASGRPPQNRRPHREVEELVECPIQLAVDVDADPEEENQTSKYESYGSVMTPSMLFYG